MLCLNVSRCAQCSFSTAMCIFSSLLRLCTTQAPFFSSQHLYTANTKTKISFSCLTVFSNTPLPLLLSFQFLSLQASVIVYTDQQAPFLISSPSSPLSAYPHCIPCCHRHAHVHTSRYMHVQWDYMQRVEGSAHHIRPGRSWISASNISFSNLPQQCFCDIGVE